jgi:hypothetical protein
MLERRSNRLPVGHIPNARCLVITGSDDALAVGAERGMTHKAAMEK